VANRGQEGEGERLSTDAAMYVFKIEQLVLDVALQHRHQALHQLAVDASVDGGDDLGDESGIGNRLKFI